MTAATAQTVSLLELSRALGVSRGYVARRVADVDHLLADPAQAPGTGRARIYSPVDAVVLAMVFDTTDCPSVREQLAEQIHTALASGERPDSVGAEGAARTVVTYSPRWDLLDQLAEVTL